MVIVLTSSSLLAQSKGEMPFSGSPEANKLLRKSWVALADFNLEEANKYTHQVLTQDPDMGMAYASIFSDDPEEITANLRRAQESKVSQDELLFIQGVQTGRNKQSPAQYFEPLLKKYPKDLYLQLWILFNYNDLKRSVEIAEGIIKRNPKFAPAYNMLGYLSMNKNDMAKAEAHFNKYMSLQPNLANPYDSKGDYLMRIGKPDEALPLYEKAFAMGMKESAAKRERAKAMLKYPKLSTTDEDIIKNMIVAASDATKKSNVDELLKDYSDQSVEIFDNQMVNVGMPNVRKRVQRMFEGGSFSKLELAINAPQGAGPVAVVYSKSESVWKEFASGKENGIKGHAIFILRKHDGNKWKILADHFYESDSDSLSGEDRNSINDLLHKWDVGMKGGEVLTDSHLEAMSSLYSAQAIEIVPNQYSNVGIANLRARWDRYLGNRMETNLLGTLGIEGAGRRAVAWGIGTQNFYLKDSQELTKLQFPWAMILTKEKDDKWKILAFHWAAD